MKYIYTFLLLFISSAVFAQRSTQSDTTRLADSVKKYDRIANSYHSCDWRKFEDAYSKSGYYWGKLDSLKMCRCTTIDHKKNK